MYPMESSRHHVLSCDPLTSPSPAHFRWIETLKKNPAMVTTGLNPSMLGVLQKTWGWPTLMVFFNCELHTFALFSAMQIRKRWVSLPHCDQGGVWLDKGFLERKGINPEKHNLLYKKLVLIAVNTAVPDQISDNNLLDINFTLGELQELVSKSNDESSKPWFVRSIMPLTVEEDPFKVISELTLDPGKEILEQLPPGPRHKIRKASRNGLEVIKGPEKLLHGFYSNYMRRMHQLGSFGLPYMFFSNLFYLYKHGDADIFMCYHDQKKIIGGAILLKFLDYSENMWFFTDPAFNHLYPSYALHHEMMIDALACGCRRYSMGRSTAGGTVQRFKSQFGGVEKNLHYCYYPKGKYLRMSNPLVSAVIKSLPTKASYKLYDTVSKYWY